MTRNELRLRVEAATAWLAFQLFRRMPIDAASALGGLLGRTIGYRLPVTRHARRNLARAFPELRRSELERTLRRMWDNLGRTVAELPHLRTLRFGPGERVELVGLDHLETARAKGRGLIFFSAHFGNWEVLGPAAAAVGIPINVVYRSPNNPYLEWLFQGRGNRDAEMIPKGARGARRALELLRQGKSLGLLVDQKMNDGIAVPFFGREAMTAPALAQFALKYRCPVLPTHVERVGGAHLRLVVEPPLAIPETSDRHEAVLAIMTEVNRIIEGWIRRRPEQWMWIHRRWPD